MPDSAVMDQYIIPAKEVVSPQQLITYKEIKYYVDRSSIGEYVQPEEFNNILQMYYNGNRFKYISYLIILSTILNIIIDCH